MDNLDFWKEERLNILKRYLNSKEYIILRGKLSWRKNSDVDVLCPTFNQKENLKRHVFKDVKIDIFKSYKIKNFNISYDKLLPYKDKNTKKLIPEIEATLFFLKDYLHLTRYRSHKHKLYSRIKINYNFCLQIGCSDSLIKTLKPSTGLCSFLINSIKCKIIYYASI